MKYRVTFVKRTDKAGNPVEKQPEGLHAQEEMGEDDSFLSMGTEIWEYDVADGRDQEFTDALKNSKMVIDFEGLEDELTTPVR